MMLRRILASFLLRPQVTATENICTKPSMILLGAPLLGGGMRRQTASSSGRGRGAKGYNEKAVNEIFNEMLCPTDEDRECLTSDGIINLASAIGITDMSDVRVLVLMWKLGSRKKPGQITREEFTTGMKALSVDSLDKLKDLVPTLDVEFLEGQDFKDFYRFAFLFSLEGSHRVIERDLIIELLPLVIGRRSEYTDRFIDFLKTQKRPEEKITADQWNSFLEFSHNYPNPAQIIAEYDADGGAWPVLLDEFVEYLRGAASGGAKKK